MTPTPDPIPPFGHKAAVTPELHDTGASDAAKTPVLALFDFDGTLIKGDSLWHFLGHTHGPLHRLLGLIPLLPRLLFSYLLPARLDAAKEKLLARFYGGMHKETLEDYGESFARDVLPALTQETVLNRLLWHKQQGHRVLVVSASPELWILPWCRLHGLEGLATRFSYSQNIFSGFFSGKNCNREEKTRRVLEYIPDWRRYSIFVYGDSDGDTDMFRLGNAAAVRVTRGHLNQIA